MKSLRPMSIGGMIVAILIVALQSSPDLQLVAVITVSVLGLGALLMLAVEAILSHSAPQPVSQPVSQPVDDSLQPYVLVADPWSQPPQPAHVVADHWSQPLVKPVAVDPQPLATAPQPARKRRDLVARNVPWTDLILDDVPAVRPVPWLEQKVAPVAVDDDPAELPDAPISALPMPRRAPTVAEYPLVWDAIMKANSRNAAILAVYGSKDGKTHKWVSRVFDFYTRPSGYETPVATSDAVFHHELIGTCDMPGMVAARLGLDVDDDQLADLMAGLAQCEDCSAWYSLAGECSCQQQEEVA